MASAGLGTYRRTCSSTEHLVRTTQYHARVCEHGTLGARISWSRGSAPFTQSDEQTGMIARFRKHTVHCPLLYEGAARRTVNLWSPNIVACGSLAVLTGHARKTRPTFGRENTRRSGKTDPNVQRFIEYPTYGRGRQRQPQLSPPFRWMRRREEGRGLHGFSESAVPGFHIGMLLHPAERTKLATLRWEFGGL